MIRTSFFLGLMLLLAAVLAFLVLQGEKTEKTLSPGSVQTVEEAPPTPTRVFSPEDLHIIRSDMAFDGEPAEEQAPATAHHRIEIGNTGTANYDRIRLRVEYVDSRGSVIDTRTLAIERDFDSESVTGLDDIILEAVPRETSGFRMTIVHADIASSVDPDYS